VKQLGICAKKVGTMYDGVDPSAVIMLVVVSLLVGWFIGLMFGLTVGVWT